jgi:hypothetical protein
MSTDYLLRKDRDFLAWVINLLKNLFPSMKRFNFPETEYTKLSSECDDYKQKLKTAEEPSTRTTVSVEIKKKARKTLETSVRTDVKAYLMYNLLVNGEDRISMGLPVHKTTRNPSSVATTCPDFDIDSSMIRRLTIHFYDRGQKKSKAKPAG